MEEKKNTTKLMAELCVDPGFILLPQSRYEELVRAETERDVLEAIIESEYSYNVDKVLSAIKSTRITLRLPHSRAEGSKNAE